MSERKRKRRGPFDIFGFDEDIFSFGSELKPTKGEGGSGYSMSVTYDEKGKPVVKVETHGDVDVAELVGTSNSAIPEPKSKDSKSSL